MTKNSGIRSDSIANFITKMGVEGVDPGSSAMPVEARKLTDKECDYLYEGIDLARYAVDGRVSDALRAGFKAYDAETGSEVRPEKEFHSHFLRQFEEAARNGRLHGVGYLLLVFDDIGWDSPVDYASAPNLVNVIPLAKREVSVIEWDGDMHSWRYGRPEIFQLNPEVSSISVSPLSNRVHHSRLLRFGGDPLPRFIRQKRGDADASVLQAAWPSIRNFVQTEQAIVTLIQRFETVKISIAGLSEALTIDEGTELVRKRMEMLHQSISILNAALIDADAGEDYSRTYANMAGLDTLWDRMAHSAAKSISEPMTRLFGMSPSGLSSDDESGKANWRARVSAFQDQEFEPNLEIYYQIANGGRPVNVVFNSLDEATAHEEAVTHKIHAQTDAVYLEHGVMSPEEVRHRLGERGFLVSRSALNEIAQELPEDEEPEEPDDNSADADVDGRMRPGPDGNGPEQPAGRGR